VAARAWSVVTVTLAGLSLGPSFAHALEAPPRLSVWPPELWIDATVRHGQFALFRLVGAPVDVAAILAAAALAFLHRKAPGFRWTAAGAVLLLAGLIAWFAIVAPANSVLATWRPGPTPADFASVRDRWEAGHMVVAALKLAGFVCLTLGVTARRPA
jgi:hypothetical protein